MKTVIKHFENLFTTVQNTETRYFSTTKTKLFALQTAITKYLSNNLTSVSIFWYLHLTRVFYFVVLNIVYETRWSILMKSYVVGHFYYMKNLI